LTALQLHAEVLQGRNVAVIRITIKKKLEDGAYARHVVVKREFTSDYLVRTGAAFGSTHMKQWAHRIATAESRLYPSCVLFEEALLRLVTPGLSFDESRRPFSYAQFDDLKGTLEQVATNSSPDSVNYDSLLE